MEMVFPNKHENTDLKETISKWAELNPNAQLTIWFDSEFTTPLQVKNSQTFIDNVARAKGGKIVLMDVRKIPKIKLNPSVFSKQTPVYFHADLDRLMATISTIEQCSGQCYFVYADWDVVPMNQEQLFDKETMKKLNKFGVVFALALGAPLNDMENLFHIIGNNKPKLIEAINTAIIDLNIERAKKALDGELETNKIPQTEALAQIVYYSIPQMFEYYYYLEGLGKLFVDGNEYYGGYSPFSPSMDPYGQGQIMTFETDDISLRGKRMFGKFQILIPTKEVETTAQVKGKGYN
jgi:hypothetical protein